MIQNSTDSTAFHGRNATQWGKMSLALYLQGRIAESIFTRNIARRLQSHGVPSSPSERRAAEKVREEPITYEELKLISNAAQQVGGGKDTQVAAPGTDVNLAEMELISKAAKQRAEGKKSDVTQPVEPVKSLLQAATPSMEKMEDKPLAKDVVGKGAIETPQPLAKQTKFCPLCMHEIPIGAKFCNQCGNRFA